MRFCNFKNKICRYDDVDLSETRSLTHRCSNEVSEESVKMNSP